MPSRRAQLLVVTLRSALVGIAAVLIATFAGIVAAIVLLIALAPRSGPQNGEVGWDLVTLLHNYGLPLAALPLTVVSVFALAFALAFRSFYRPSADK